MDGSEPRINTAAYLRRKHRSAGLPRLLARWCHVDADDGHRQRQHQRFAAAAQHQATLSYGSAHSFRISSRSLFFFLLSETGIIENDKTRRENGGSAHSKISSISIGSISAVGRAKSSIKENSSEISLKISAISEKNENGEAK